MSKDVNSVALAFVSGFADALFFISLGGIFVGLITGNVILLSLGLINHADGGLSSLQALTFPSFLLGAGVAAILAKKIATSERATRHTLLVIAVAFALSAFVGAALGEQDYARYSALPAAFAMGCLTAVDRIDSGLGPPFSLMTGNMAGVAASLARRLVVGISETSAEAEGSLSAIMIVAGFACGCVTGALLSSAWGLPAMLLPAVIVAAIALQYSRPESATTK